MPDAPIRLRDQSITYDTRLDRLIEFDERSRSFGIMATLDTRTPRSYTWGFPLQSLDPITPFVALDQGREGACVGFAITHELAARPAPVKGLGNGHAQGLYYDAQRIDPWPGGEYPGANPVYGGTSVLSGVKAARARGWFDSYRWSFSLNELILGVGYHGPAVLGLNWYDDSYDPDPAGFIRPTGDYVGGHAILCRGVNVRDRYFILRNSWGPTWGQNGDCRVTFADMETWLARQGEAVFFVDRHS